MIVFIENEISVNEYGVVNPLSLIFYLKESNMVVIFEKRCQYQARYCFVVLSLVLFAFPLQSLAKHTS